jgi:hypothetical protein
MSEFNDRERAQEKKFELDQELEFRAQARRARLVGEWAAQRMGLDQDEGQAYAKTVILADLEEAGAEDLFRKIRGDLDAKQVAVSDHEIRTVMDECLETARQQMKAGV